MKNQREPNNNNNSSSTAGRTLPNGFNSNSANNFSNRFSRTNNDFQNLSQKFVSTNNFAPSFPNDPNSLSNAPKPNGTDWINPWFYFQILNANAMFLQQFSILQNNVLSTQIENQRTAPFLPKNHNFRPLTSEQIAENARFVYQRALHRNRIQQQNEFLKNFDENFSFNSTNNLENEKHFQQVPTVPNVNQIGSPKNAPSIDTMINSKVFNCSSPFHEGNIGSVRSTSSFASTDEAQKNFNKNNSLLDPSAPIFVPRSSQIQQDEDSEISSSSSESDFNDFEYLDKFLVEFYSTENLDENKLILRRVSQENAEENRSSNEEFSFSLGQGDGRNKNPQTNVSTSNVERKYSIVQLLDRFRNPRSHLVLAEWSRLALILPQVCSMRAQNYKIKRYFAFRRRLSENKNLLR